MTRSEAKAAIAKYGSARKAGTALGCAGSTISRAVASGGCESAQTTASATACTVKGFSLTATTRVSVKRPAATVKSRFYDLKRGIAYREQDIAREWNISAGTLRKHAQDAECFRYIDTSGHDTWEPCVMHPDTAKQYPCK